MFLISRLTSIERASASMCRADPNQCQSLNASPYLMQSRLGVRKIQVQRTISNTSSLAASSSLSPREWLIILYLNTDDLIYKGHLLPLQVPPSLDMARQHEVGDGKGSLHWGNVNGVKSQFPNLLKTATKLKISLLRFKKSARVGMDLEGECGRSRDSNVQRQSKYFIVKFKMVDLPLFFRFIGDNSRGSKTDESRNWFQRKSEVSHQNFGQCKSNERDKKRVKEVVQKYVKMIKPLYLKICQKYSEKTKHEPIKKSRVANRTIHTGFSGSERIHQKRLSFYDKLKMVYKPSCKEDNSFSSLNPAVPKNYSESTVMELQNAIQGAITHCKRSNYTEDASTSSALEGSPYS
ncbi:uncharacterized protein LOC131059935 isoform X2 [Cryptomeria japonica]|uniref:uncharacterized protein LOC131059935 isoform X2 n=1 Tax=Cryptomeria japonica TaxID=3369 RepID=UPI0025ACC535|nr:uncharacterized protein LOC131059935 isoform X2 [Cryptomeria japonica]